MEMKSFFFSGLLFFCLLTIMAEGQNFLPQQAIENFKKSKGLMINPDDDMSMQDKSISSDLPSQDPIINPSSNNRKKKVISKLNGSMYRPATVIFNNNLRYTYSYDKDGNVLSVIEDQWWSYFWENNFKDSFTYDNKRNVIVKLRETWGNNGWKNFQRHTNTYDNNGNLLTYLDQTWASETWLNSSRNTFTYDNNGNMLTELFSTWDWIDNVWVNYYRYSYTYDNDGNVLTDIYEICRNNAWVNTQKHTFTYDNDWHMLTYLSEIWTNNTWMNTSRNSYTYDNNGNRLTLLAEHWSNHAWVNLLRYSYTYDNDGNMLAYIYEVWSNNNWVNRLRYTTTYDNNGYLSTVLYETWINNSWIYSLRKTSTYDNNGNQLTFLSEKWMNDVWMETYRNTYTYNNYGSLLTELKETLENNVWINSYRYAYTYDDAGNAIKGEYFSWAYSGWVATTGELTLYYNCGMDTLLFKTATSINVTYTLITTNVPVELTSFIAKIAEDKVLLNWVTATEKNNFGFEIQRSSNKQNFAKIGFVNGFGSTTEKHSYIFTDKNPDSGNNFYRLKQIDLDGTVSYSQVVEGVKINVPQDFNLSQNYPNPFNPSTVIQYALPYESSVSITVYNTLGQIVETFNEGTKQTGSYNINFNGEGLSSGIYLYNINAVSINGKQNFQATKKMILIK